MLEMSEHSFESKVALVEALIFANGEPLAPERVCEVSGIEPAELEEILALLLKRYADSNTGIELVCVAAKYQFRTRPQFSEIIRELKAKRPKKLSPSALETLSVVAYRQPIVKSDIEQIRGVDATPTIKTLLEKRLIKITGHKATVGQPALYGTTEEFLEVFGLSSLSELPTLRDLKELEADPGEAPETAALQAS
jgi:segregation and condensation protein B